MKPLGLFTQGLNTGCHESSCDARDIKDRTIAQAYPYPLSFETFIDALNIKGTDERYQKKIGVCVACTITTYVEWLYWKKTGTYVKLSVAFCYIVIKTLIDKNRLEGTSARSAIKAVMKYGICTEATFPTNYDLTHDQFLDQKIPDAAWTEALNYKIGGYISVPVERSLMAGHIHKYGLLITRYDCGETWWYPSWLPKDILPLKKPNLFVSGHMVLEYYYDLATKSRFGFLNWWSKKWANLGTGYSDLEDFAPTEAWALTLESVMPLKVDNSPLVEESAWRKLLSALRLLKLIH